MSFLPDELKIQPFRCPNCHQYISSEAAVCKFCTTPITAEIRKIGLEKEKREKIGINLKRHKNMLITGIVLFLLGIFSVVTPIIEIHYSQNVNVNCLTPIFLVAGLILTISGFMGYLKEKKNLKNV